MYRLSALRGIPTLLYTSIAYDWGINICVASDSLIGFLHTPCSVYRIHKKGAWNSLDYAEQIKLQLDSISHYDKVTDGKFNNEFQTLSERLSLSLGVTSKTQPLRRRVRAVLAACVPPIFYVAARWIIKDMSSMLLPPIVKIIIVKMRRYWK
jgi:hypothetical protein